MSRPLLHVHQVNTYFQELTGAYPQIGFGFLYPEVGRGSKVFWLIFGRFLVGFWSVFARLFHLGIAITLLESVTYGEFWVKTVGLSFCILFFFLFFFF